MTRLIRWRRPAELMVPLRDEMEDLFERFFGHVDEGNGAAKAWAPRVDIEETDKQIVVKADLPGVDPKDVEVTIADGALVIKGEKKEEKEQKDKNYHRIERFVGQFYRQIPLPVGADADRMSAASAKGVVTVTIPKKADAQPKKVVVKAAE